MYLLPPPLDGLSPLSLPYLIVLDDFSWTLHDDPNATNDTTGHHLPPRISSLFACCIDEPLLYL